MRSFAAWRSEGVVGGLSGQPAQSIGSLRQKTRRGSPEQRLSKAWNQFTFTICSATEYSERQGLLLVKHIARMLSPEI